MKSHLPKVSGNGRKAAHLPKVSRNSRKAAEPYSFRRSRLIPERREFPLVVPPVGIDLDVELQEDLLLEEVLHVDAGLGADTLEGRAAGADDYALLGVAHDVDDGPDVVTVGILLELLDDHLGAVGNLFVVVGEYLLADDLGGKEAEVAVGEEVLVVPGLALGQQRHYASEHRLEPEPLLSRDREDFRMGHGGGPLRGQGGHGLLVAQVDLVDDDEHRAVHTAQPLDVFPVLVSLLHHVGDVEDDVGIPDGGVDVLHHGALEIVGRLEDSRSVGVDYLVVLSVDNAHDTVPGGLGFGCDDGKALPDEGVHQRGLAHVGVAYDVYETGTVRMPLHYRLSCG